MPASRAACSGSPFFTAPRRINRNASRDIVMVPRAMASRAVTGLSPTSTILTRPRRSICERLFPAPPGLPASPARPALLAATGFSLRQEEREAFEGNRQVDAFQLHVVREMQRAGREVQDRLDARGDDEVEDLLRRRLRHGDDGDADAFATRDLLQIVDVVDRDAAARLLPHLLAQVVEERRDLEPLLAETGIVGEREAQVAGTHDRDAQLAIESENLPQVPFQVADVIADTADTELTEVREVLSNLRGVQMELLGERLR